MAVILWLIKIKDKCWKRLVGVTINDYFANSNLFSQSTTQATLLKSIHLEINVKSSQSIYESWINNKQKPIFKVFDKVTVPVTRLWSSVEARPATNRKQWRIHPNLSMFKPRGNRLFQEEKKKHMRRKSSTEKEKETGNRAQSLSFPLRLDKTQRNEKSQPIRG